MNQPAFLEEGIHRLLQFRVQVRLKRNNGTNGGALPEPPDYSDPCRYLRQSQAKEERVCGSSGEASGSSKYTVCTFDTGRSKGLICREDHCPGRGLE